MMLRLQSTMVEITTLIIVASVWTVWTKVANDSNYYYCAVATRHHGKLYTPMLHSRQHNFNVNTTGSRCANYFRLPTVLTCLDRTQQSEGFGTRALEHV